MDVIGISKDEQMQIWRMLAAILILGNIEFVPDDKDNAQVKDKNSFFFFMLPLSHLCSS